MLYSIRTVYIGPMLAVLCACQTDLYCAVKFVFVVKASRLVTIEVENWSQALSISDISVTVASVLYMHYIDDLLPHAQVQLYSYIQGTWSSVHN